MLVVALPGHTTSVTCAPGQGVLDVRQVALLAALHQRSVVQVTKEQLGCLKIPSSAGSPQEICCADKIC